VSALLQKRALILGVANATDYALQFLLPVVLVRCLDAATFGEYRLLWLAVGTVMAVAQFGIPQGLYFFLPRSDAPAKALYVRQTLLCLGLAGLLAAFFLSPWNPWLPPALLPLGAYGALVPTFIALWLTASLLDLLPSIDERVGWQARVSIGTSVLRAALLSVGAFATGELRVLLWLLIAHVLLKLALLAGYIARFHGANTRWLERKLFAEQVRHSAPIGVSSTLYGLRGQVDQWVAASIFALHSFAAFSIAAVISPLVTLFRVSINNAFLPSMSRLQASGDIGAMMAMNRRANALAAGFICPLLAFVFAFAPDIITVIYTEAYVEAAPAMRLYCIGLLAGLVEVGSVLLLLRQGTFAMAVNAGALGVSALLSWFAAVEIGLAGAAAGSVVAIYLDRALMLRRISSCAGMPVALLQDWKVLGVRVATAALSAAFAWIVASHALAEAHPLQRLALGALCLSVVYGALYLLSRAPLANAASSAVEPGA
jgi:O-antigen/teichoic acid export membrane protein